MENEARKVIARPNPNFQNITDAVKKDVTKDEVPGMIIMGKLPKAD